MLDACCGLAEPFPQLREAQPLFHFSFTIQLVEVLHINFPLLVGAAWRSAFGWRDDDDSKEFLCFNFVYLLNRLH